MYNFCFNCSLGPQFFPLLGQLRGDPLCGARACFLPGVPGHVPKVPLGALVGEAERCVQHGEQVPPERRDDAYEGPEHHAHGLHDVAEDVENGKWHRQPLLNVESQRRRHHVVEIRVAHMWRVVGNKVEPSPGRGPPLRVSEAAGGLEVTCRYVAHIDRVDLGLRQGHSEKDVPVSNAVHHVAQQEAATLAVDVHGPEGAGGQPSAVWEELVVGLQGSQFGLLFGLAVVELQGTFVLGLLGAVDDGFAFRVWPHHLDGAGVNEAQHVLLDGRLEKQLRP